MKRLFNYLIIFIFLIFSSSALARPGDGPIGGGGGSGGTDDQTAAEVATDTTNFDTNLSATEDTVQKALDILDDVVGGGTDDQTAAEVSIDDAGTIITGTTVETALQENRVAIDALELVDNWTEAENTTEGYWTESEFTTKIGAVHDTAAELTALFGGKQATLTNEDGLYAALSDVTQFYEVGDKVGDADTLDTHDTDYFQTAITGTDKYVLFFDTANVPAGHSGLQYNKTTGILTSVKGFAVTPTATGGQLSYWLEDTDNGSNYVGWGSPAANANDLILDLPVTDPTAGQHLEFAAPTSVTGSDNVARNRAQGTWTPVGKYVAPVPLTGDADDFDNNFTGDYLYGGTYICNATGTCILPVMVSGMNFTIITLGAIAVIVDTNVADGYLHNGVTGTEGKHITNGSTAGDLVVVQSYDAADWLMTSNDWTPE